MIYMKFVNRNKVNNAAIFLGVCYHYKHTIKDGWLKGTFFSSHFTTTFLKFHV